MTPRFEDEILQAVDLIVRTFDAFLERQDALVRRARDHFGRGDWQAAHEDAARRLDLYNLLVRDGLDRLHSMFGPRIGDRDTWVELREAYAARVSGRGDAEVAETFFNSFTRRIFHTVGVDPAYEFVAIEDGRDAAIGEGAARAEAASVAVTFARRGELADLFAEVLAQYRFEAPWDDAAGDAARIAEAVAEQVGRDSVRGLELARAVFFRGRAAYLVGRLMLSGGVEPFLLALRRVRGRVVVDAVLLTEDEVSIVFSFARSYFLVEMERPRAMVAFLRTIMPRKPVAELYNAIGWNKQGKTELYRSILRHLATTDDRFEIAPGQRGMVMHVFTLPRFDVVFKVIRDRFAPPKTVSAEEVREKYRMVFRHDRAGRLVDAQEFEHLVFDRARFEERLLAELEETCAERVAVRGDRVVISHLYTERRLRPLDVYLREADPASSREAVVDYGQVLRDLAATNIFPGDMLLKNFGVSRHGRLIFYDYDELCRLDECHFRSLPPVRDGDDEATGEPWFYVGERDIFPEEFGNFLGLSAELRQVFLEHHAALLGPEFWRRMQALHARGEVPDVYPYRSARRLRRSDGPESSVSPSTEEQGS